MSAVQAEDTCADGGGHLFYPESPEELSWVIVVFGNGESHFFIGIRDFIAEYQNIIAMDYSLQIGFRPFTHTPDGQVGPALGVDVKPVCKKPLADGFGASDLISSKHLLNTMDSSPRNRTLEHLIQFEGPGVIWVSIRDLTTEQKFVQFTFLEEVLLSGLVISTHRNYSVRSFRLRANIDPGNIHDLET